MNGIVTTNDDLYIQSIAYIAAHPELGAQLEGVGGNNGGKSLALGGALISKVFGSMRSSLNSSSKSAAIRPEGELDTVRASTPFWLTTYKLRHTAEVKMIETKMLKERIFCSLFVILLEDLPIRSMNLDMIAKSQLFGCPIGSETSSLFVCLTFAASVLLGFKLHKVLGLFGEQGVSHRLIDLEKKIDLLTLKGTSEFNNWKASGEDLEAQVYTNSVGNNVAVFPRRRSIGGGAMVNGNAGERPAESATNGEVETPGPSAGNTKVEELETEKMFLLMEIEKLVSELDAMRRR
jgi:hypothetical protein